MENQKSNVYGFGFVVCASDKALKEFILAHRDTICSLHAYDGLEHQGREAVEYCENTPEEEFNPKEALFDYISGMTAKEGIYGLIADVMWAETGIGFGYYPNYDGDDEVILFEAEMPWMMNEKEKNITEDELEEICNKYINELNPSLTFSEIHAAA